MSLHFRSFGVATGLSIASILQHIGRTVDLPQTADITYSRIFREIGSSMIFGAYAGERFISTDATCDNDGPLQQIFREYGGKLEQLDFLNTIILIFLLLFRIPKVRLIFSFISAGRYICILYGY